MSYLHLQKGSLLTKGHRQLWSPTEEATQKMAMTQIAKQSENSKQAEDYCIFLHDIHSYSIQKTLFFWCLAYLQTKS